MNNLNNFLNDRLNESILTRTSSKVTDTVGKIKNMTFFGGMYELEEFSLGMKSEDGIGVIKLKALKDANKDNELSNTELSKVEQFNDERVVELLKYIENINMSEMGFPNFNCNVFNDMYDFIDAVEVKMKQDGIFNSPKGVRVQSYRGPKHIDKFEIIVRRKSKSSGVWLTFKKRTNI